MFFELYLSLYIEKNMCGDGVVPPCRVIFFRGAFFLGGGVKKFGGAQNFFCMQKSTYFSLNKHKNPKNISACGGRTIGGGFYAL